MKDQLRNLLFKFQPIFPSLNFGPFEGDCDITKTALQGLFGAIGREGKRQYIRRSVLVAKASVELSYLPVRDKGDCRAVKILANRLERPLAEGLPALAIHLSSPLPAHNLYHSIVSVAEALLSNIGFLGMIFVGANNHLDQFVAHDIFLREVDKLDTF